jgi:transposase
MENCGLDLHKMESQVCIVDELGEVKFERRIATSRESFRAQLTRPKMRIVVESSTESEWAARALENLGHEVIVADPNFAPMYATRDKRVKTDKRDARALAQACQLGAYRPAHRVSDEQRRVRTMLLVRQQHVECRSAMISLARSVLRGWSYRVKSGMSESFPKRVVALKLTGEELSQLAPLLASVSRLGEQIDEIEELLKLATRDDPNVRRAQTMTSIGLITAAALVATFDGAERFHTVQQARSYLGLVPREMSSGEQQRRGHITKVGNRRTRALLVQAAWGILRSRRPEVAHLKNWATTLAARRGKRIAVVALARRIAGILWAMLRDQRDYLPPTQLKKSA